MALSIKSDEADRLADMGFMPAVRRILEQVHPDRQTLMFSATLDGAVGKLAASVQRDPVRHEIGPIGPDMNNARHAYWSVERADRSDVTADIVREKERRLEQLRAASHWKTIADLWCACWMWPDADRPAPPVRRAT